MIQQVSHCIFALPTQITLPIQLTNVGIHVVVAAGNQTLDAGDFSPARSPGAITVGACTIANRRADFFNYGAVVDLFAPGDCVTSVRTNTLDEVCFPLFCPSFNSETFVFSTPS